MLLDFGNRITGGSVRETFGRSMMDTRHFCSGHLQRNTTALVNEQRHRIPFQNRMIYLLHNSTLLLLLYVATVCDVFGDLTDTLGPRYIKSGHSEKYSNLSTGSQGVQYIEYR